MLNLNEDPLEIPANAHELVQRNSPTFALYASQYGHLIKQTIVDDGFRQQMSTNALTAASKRSWSAAMDCLIRGYRAAAVSSRKRQAARLTRLSSANSSTVSLKEVVQHSMDTDTADCETVVQTSRLARFRKLGRVFRRRGKIADSSDVWPWRATDSLKIRRETGQLLPEHILYESKSATALCITARGMLLDASVKQTLTRTVLTYFLGALLTYLTLRHITLILTPSSLTFTMPDV